MSDGRTLILTLTGAEFARLLTQHPVERVGRVPFELRREVGVGVHGQTDLAVTQPPHDGAHADAPLQEERGGAVAQVVEPLPRQTGLLQQLVQPRVYVRGVEGCPATRREDQTPLLPVVAGEQPAFVL